MENEQKNNEFKFINLTIEKIGILIGILLFIWGIIVSIITQSNSFTSYIPSIMGIPILILCFLSFRIPSMKKIFMHMVVLLSVLLIIGGLDLFRDIFSSESSINVSVFLSKLLMLLLGTLFTYLCIS